MTRGTRVALFMLGGTVFNILTTFVIFVSSLAIYSFTLAKILPESAIMWAIVASFVLSLVGAVLIYKKAISFLRAKYDLDEKLGLNRKK